MSNKFANSKKRKCKSRCERSLAGKKLKPKISYNASRYKYDLGTIKPKLKSDNIFNKYIMENNNDINFDAKQTDKNDNYGTITLFMRDVLISLCKTSWFFSIGSNILLSTKPNLLLVIFTKAFEMINWDQYTETMGLKEYSCSFTLKLFLTFMSIIKIKKIHLFQTDILFLTLIIFGKEFLYDINFRQFSKVFNLKQEVINDKLKN